MAITAFRFEPVAPPRDVLVRCLRDELGERLHVAIDSVEAGEDSATGCDEVVWVLSQDYVALAYVGRAMSRLGGVRVDPNGHQPREDTLPAWTATPWRDHGWLARLRIRFSGANS
ncbi:MAG: hypothetical protein AAF799_19300 [Myxococcota bacterium]